MSLVGLIVPSSNPSIETVLQHLPVASVLSCEFLCTRIQVQRIGIDTDSDAQFTLTAFSQAASLLADAEVASLMWAGTSGSWLGPEFEHRLIQTLAESTGKPAATSVTATMAALAEYAPDSVGMITPYIDPVHHRVLSFMNRSGYSVQADVALGIETNLDFARIPSSELQEHITQMVTQDDVDVVTIMCTNVMGALAGLRQAPVVDSLLATLWFGARLAGATDMQYHEAYREILR